MLSLLTINIQAAARSRAERLLRWLSERDDDIVILTETSAGPGTTYLLDQCRSAGLVTVHTSLPGERGAALLTRLPVTPRPELTASVSLPARAVAATIHGPQPVTVLGVYVPSSDRAPDKLLRKQTFVSSLLAAIDALDPGTRTNLVLGGDYNVISRDHQPAYRGFLPFEYALLDALHAHGLTDAHQHHAPGVQTHSWIGRTGNGYRFDYFHTGPALTGQIIDCAYLLQPRDQQLSDHAAVTLTLDIPTGTRLANTSPSSSTLF